jgi:metal-responsive CopG/Arc/MetJ family transcriptional regulator
MKKIAITLTEEQAAAVEKLRRRRRVPRSRVIQEAVARFLESEGASSLVQAYETGYRRLPEDVREARAFAEAGAAILPLEDWE